MSGAVKDAILLEISSGAAKRLPFSTESLTDDNIVAVLDEIHEVIWLWMGKNTGLIMRRGSMRVARSLKAYGHEIGPSIVGRKLKDVIAIDGLRIESDLGEKANFEKVISLFTQEHTIKLDFLAEFQVLGKVEQPAYYGLSRSQRDDLVQAAIAAPSAGDDSRKIEEIVGEFQGDIPSGSSTTATFPKKTPPKPATKVSAASVSPPKPATKVSAASVSPPKPATKVSAASVSPPKPTVKPGISPSKGPPKPAAKVDIPLPDISETEILELPEEQPIMPFPMEDEPLIGEVKAAIVLTSILSEYNDIFLGVKTEDDQKVYNIEGPEGLICRFTLDKSKIQFLPGSWEKINPDKKRKIQKLFIDRVKTLIGT